MRCCISARSCRGSPADAAKVYAANVTGTFNLLAAAASAKVQRFVLASTGEVYPEVRPRYLPVDEAIRASPSSRTACRSCSPRRWSAFFHRTQGLPFVVLRFAHTQDARELLDPASFFSGPRFYLRSKIRQQRAFGNARALAVLEPLDDGREQAPVQCGEDGAPYRMTIADARDIADGVVLALDASSAPSVRRSNLGSGRGDLASTRRLRCSRRIRSAGRARASARAGGELRHVECACARTAGIPAALDIRHDGGRCSGRGLKSTYP